MGLIEVTRGGMVESSHRVHVAVVDAHDRLVGASGDPRWLTYFRSAAKPLQALPLVEEGVVDALELTGEELAVCCASHGGERAHLGAVRGVLDRAGLGENHLECGPEEPLRPAVAHLGRTREKPFAEPRAIHHNCSGKHAGMLALARHMGWPTEDYHLADHPVQKRMVAEISRWTEISPPKIVMGRDGCGVPCYGVPLRAMALSMARFGRAAAEGEAPATIVDAMSAHPFFVGGTGRTCTDVMRGTGDGVFVKVGAEGVFVGGIPDVGLGFSLKVSDGASRAAGVAMTRLLADLGVLDDGDLDHLADHVKPQVYNSRGEVVGAIRAAGPMFHTPSINAPGWARASAGGRTLRVRRDG